MSPGGPGPLRASSQAGSAPAVQGLFTGPRRLFRNTVRLGFCSCFQAHEDYSASFMQAWDWVSVGAEITQPRPRGLTVKHSEAEGHPADRLENCQVFRNNLGVS